MKKRKKSSSKSSILDVFKQSDTLVLDALHGTGKTSTLMHLAKVNPMWRVLVLSKTNVAVEKAKTFGLLPNMQCMTLHGLAYRALRPHARLFHRLSGRWVAWRYKIEDFVFSGQYLPARMIGVMGMSTVSFFCQTADVSLSIRHVRSIEHMRYVPDSMRMTEDDLTRLKEQILAVAKRLWHDQNQGLAPITHDVYAKIWMLTNPKVKSRLIVVDEAQELTEAWIDWITKQSAKLVFAVDRYLNAFNPFPFFETLEDRRVSTRVLLRDTHVIPPDIAKKANVPLIALGDTGYNQSFAMPTDARKRHVHVFRDEASLVQTLMREQNARVLGAQSIITMLKELQSLRYNRHRGRFALFPTWDEFMDYAQDHDEFNLWAELIVDYGLENIIEALSASRNNQDNHSHIFATPIFAHLEGPWDVVTLVGADWMSCKTSDFRQGQAWRYAVLSSARSMVEGFEI